MGEDKFLIFTFPIINFASILRNVNLKKKLLFNVLTISIINVAAAQTPPFKSYTQNLKGTDLKFDMVAVPAGEFKMGSPANEKGRKEDEGPQHAVKVDAFWMGKYEVMWDIFEPYVYKNFELTQSKGSIPAEVDAVTRPTKPYLDMTFAMGKEGFPAVGMTQYNAIQFCKWLYTRTGIFYRLPTEAEWEYASRAGTSTAYSFGNDPAYLGDYAWFAGNSKGKTQPSGTKKPNAWGLYDMYGNAIEFTYDQYLPDFYAKFKGKAAANPVAKPELLYPHTVRGGSFQDEPPNLRSASRQASNAKWKRLDPQIPKSNWWFPEAPFIGFRLVRPLFLPSKEEIEAYYNQEPIQDF